MLKFFFNKDSKVVLGMEILGVTTLIMLLVTLWPAGKTIPIKIAFILYIVLYIFIRVFASLRWYKDAERYEGIELQFKRAMVPTSYILPLSNILLLIGGPGVLLYFSDFLLIVIAHVNVILIYFHLKDRETLKVNYFTHNKHLKN